MSDEDLTSLNSSRSSQQDEIELAGTGVSIKYLSTKTNEEEKSSRRKESSSEVIISALYLDKLADNDNSTNGLLYNPLKSGYFLRMTKREHNSENLIYVLEINRFKDHFRDIEAWNDDLGYKVIDNEIENFGKLINMQEKDLVIKCSNGIEKWPSKKIAYAAFQDHCQFIWDTYLSCASTTQICMPAKVLYNMMHRLQHLEKYGHKVFDETLIDPIKTLNADVLPRFLVSPCFKAMNRRLVVAYPLPTKDQIELKMPAKSACMNWNDDQITVDNLSEMPLKRLLHDKILYKEFLDYCKRSHCEENIYLARAITIYKSNYENDIDKAAMAKNLFPPWIEGHVWMMFRFFIAPNSPYEIGMPEKRRKEIIHHLASPTKDMFDVLESSTFRILRAHYLSFANTKEFQQIPSIIISAKRDAELNLKNKLKTKKGPSTDKGSWLFGRWFGSRVATVDSNVATTNGVKYL